MEGLAVFAALNHSGPFGKNFVKFNNIYIYIYMLFTDKVSVRMVKNCDLGLENAARGHSRQITYMPPVQNCIFSSTF